MNEFIPIKGYEGFYSINDKGDVYSHKTNKLLKHFYNRKGYSRVCLSIKGKAKNFLVHRLVISCFNYASNMQVDHVDGNIKNNHVSNLEYVENRENSIRYQKRIGKSGNAIQYGKYAAQVWHKGKNHWGGYYNTKLEATNARKKLKEKLNNQAINNVLNYKEGE